MLKDIENGVCVLTHDLHPYGAQRVALSLVRSLIETHKLHVEVVTVGGGDLSIPVRRLAPIHALGALWKEQARSLKNVLPVLRRAKIRKAITNTVIVGHMAETLREDGIEVVSLVHEMPKLVKEEGLIDRLKGLHEHAKHVVYPHERVALAVKQAFPDLPNWDRVRSFAQGVETTNPYRANKQAARSKVRASFGTDVLGPLAVAIGIADHRKGFDLFLDAARTSAARASATPIHYLWIGPKDQSAVSMWRQRNGGMQPESIPNFHWLDYQSEITHFYAAADVFVLSSREDPMPFVALEAMNAATPLVAFRGTGGGAALAERGFGVVVDELSGAALAAAIEDALADVDRLRKSGLAGAATIDTEFSFERYVESILTLFER
jgi:O-antigen biosynthesis protein